MMNEIKVNLGEGLEFEINANALSDWRLVEMFSELDENPIVTVKIAKFLLTADSYDKLKTVNTDKDTGYIDAEKIEKTLIDIIMKASDLKK